MKLGIKIRPHIGLIKIEYSIHPYTKDGFIDPEVVENTNKPLIVGVVGQDRDICIRKVRELVEDFKNAAIENSTSTTT